MGAYSTTPLEPASVEGDSSDVAGAADAVAEATNSSAPALVARSLAWIGFLGGLIGAGVGIAGLHVEIAVIGLILGCTAGLVLLKLRADGAVAETT